MTFFYVFLIAYNAHVYVVYLAVEKAFKIFSLYSLGNC